ncbi:hypothetical protein RISK_003826 [Rhodopirellula islandica]|uniref:Uncharacterized protein n=1 Tax=Rhodopirellula islandica TaxID=595434 RepID=A0A0J1BC75_RHOIS|nr:hypothetical protein RISK_003826 [Rhodopirellula islandica]
MEVHEGVSLRAARLVEVNHHENHSIMLQVYWFGAWWRW